MEYIAESKNIKISPRKVRLVVEAIKHLELTRALNSLTILNKRAATPVRKALESAVANAVNNFQADKSGLKIKEIMVNEGIMYKRYHYAARGRVRPYKKRTSHIRVILADNLVRSAQSPIVTSAPVATDPAEAKAVDVQVAPEQKKEKQSIMNRLTRRKEKK